MLLRIGLAVILPLCILIGLTARQSFSLVSEQSLEYTQEEGWRYANQIGASLEVYVGMARAMAANFGEYRQLQAGERSALVSRQIHSLLQSNPSLLGAWIQWESKSGSGRFATILYRENGEIRQRSLHDEDYSRDFYLVPKIRSRESILSPYHWNPNGAANGYQYLTSLSEPIIVDGEFLGVFGLHLAVSEYQNLVSSIRILKSGYAVLVANDGQRVYHPLKQKIGDLIADDLGPGRQKEILRQIAEARVFTVDKLALVGGAFSRQFFIPITIGDTRTPWYIVCVVPLAEIRSSAVGLVTAQMLIGAGILILVFVVIFLTSRGITRPILRLSHKAEILAEGGLPEWQPSDDEVSFLSRRFDAMAEKLGLTLAGLRERNSQLKTARDSLAKLNSELERRVAQRSAELIAAEKMASLGRLVTRIAHELNTPLGTIRSSVQFAMKEFSALDSSLPELIEAMDAKDQAAFLKLSLRENPEELRLAERAGDKSALIIKKIQDAGLQAEAARVDDLESLPFEAVDLAVQLLAGGKEKLVSLAAHFCSLKQSMALILRAEELASRAVEGLETYSRSDRPQQQAKPEYSNLEAGLEEALAREVPNSALVRIHRGYSCKASVLGKESELIQIWSSLIRNALQAMAYKGELSIRTWGENSWAAVSIANPGPRIPAEIQSRIFEPFFSTRAPGEGAGLGLFTAHKIVEALGGSIGFTSDDDRTVFTIRLQTAIKTQ